MAKFLSAQEIYRLLQRELPEGAYPDGPPSRYYSTADMYAVADGLASGYSNLKRIYDNYFPQTADEKMPEWEDAVFGSPLDASLPLQQRRDKVLLKLRNPFGITKLDIINVVKNIIGQDKIVEVREWGCADGGWMLDYSQLDISTFLNGENLVDAALSASCNKPEFKTQEEWETAQEEAYTYEVLVYDYTLTASEREEIDRQLDIEEPARSAHVITDNLPEVDMIEGED